MQEFSSDFEVLPEKELQNILFVTVNPGPVFQPYGFQNFCC